MAYHLIRGESPDSSIKRIASEQVQRSIGYLSAEESPSRDDGIYETRKAFKQLRAVLRLVRHEIGEVTYQTENNFYRDMGQNLAPLRDSYVSIVTLGNFMASQEDALLKKTATNIRRSLQRRYEKVRKQMLQESSILTETMMQLEDAQERIAAWTIASSDFAAYQTGIKRTYQRGQAAMEAAAENPSSIEAFHEWRKYVKYLWYHVRILAPLQEDILNSYALELKQLSDYLGDAHDLAVLYDTLALMQNRRDGAWHKLRALMDYQRGELEQRALLAGKSLYAEDHKDFVARLARYWEAPQDEQASA